MANAHRRLLNEAITGMRQVDYKDKPSCNIQEAIREKRDLAPICVRRRMLGMPNVSSTIDGVSKKYDMRRNPHDETDPYYNSPAAYFLKLYPKQKKSPVRFEEKMTWGCR